MAAQNNNHNIKRTIERVNTAGTDLNDVINTASRNTNQKLRMTDHVRVSLTKQQILSENDASMGMKKAAVTVTSSYESRRMEDAELTFESHSRMKHRFGPSLQLSENSKLKRSDNKS